jgi:adenylate kinase family enzyme
MSLDRIAVIGISASGKSIFSRMLAARTGLPLRHGDQLDWLANWGVRPEDELNIIHRSWIAEPRWIIEGWVDVGRTERLDTADLVIDLDFSAVRCAARALRRMLVAERRPEMPPGCVDRFSWQTLDWVLWKKERPAIDAALGAAKLKNYVRLRTPRAAAQWLQSLSAP